MRSTVIDHSTKAQWEQLAHEAGEDARYWKGKAREAQRERDELRAALVGMMAWARRVKSINPGPEVAVASDALSSINPGRR